MIRQAVADDLPQIEDLVKKAVAVMNKAGNDQWNAEYPLMSHFEDDIKANELYAYIVEEKVAGVACFSEKEHEEYPEINWSYPDKAITIKRAAVDPAFQGTGIASQLYVYAETVALKRNISYIKTDTFRKNKPAQLLFRRSGYKYVEEKYMPEKDDRILYFEKKL